MSGRDIPAASCVAADRRANWDYLDPYSSFHASSISVLLHNLSLLTDQTVTEAAVDRLEVDNHHHVNPHLHAR